MAIVNNLNATDPRSRESASIIPVYGQLPFVPVRAAAAVVAVIESIKAAHLLRNVREREAQIREQCVVGPVIKIQGIGLLLGLVCDRPAIEVRDFLLDHDILTGTSSDPDVVRILAPLVIEERHVTRLAETLALMAPTGI